MIAVRQSAAVLRREIEEGLAERVPDALTPRLRAESERFACGLTAIDGALSGGVPVGAITELVGPECSGRTTMAMAYAAASIRAGNVAAWIDVDDVLHPEGAALSGVDLERLLWVRCGLGQSLVAEGSSLFAVQAKGSGGQTLGQPLGISVPQGGCGSPHPRSEGMGMPQAIQDLLLAQPRSSALPARRRDKSIGTPGAPNRPVTRQPVVREEQVATDRLPPRRGERVAHVVAKPRYTEPQRRSLQAPAPVQTITPARAEARTEQKRELGPKRVWTPLDQALRATDLLLQSGGFRLLVLDLGSTPAEMAWRVPLATWFRYRAACARTQTSLLLLTRHTCAKSSAELVVRLETGRMETEGGVLTGIAYRAERERQRFQALTRNVSHGNVVPIRKPPQPERPGVWKGRAAWAL